LIAAKEMGASCVQGHAHSQFEVQSYKNERGAGFGMTTGCLADNDSLSMEYHTSSFNHGIHGCGVIKNGHPILIKM